VSQNSSFKTRNEDRALQSKAVNVLRDEGRDVVVKFRDFCRRKNTVFREREFCVCVGERKDESDSWLCLLVV
jgi:hypothetical protein